MALRIPVKVECVFHSADDANKFLEQFVGAGYGYTITIPCPNHSLLNQTFGEDESGK